MRRRAWMLIVAALLPAGAGCLRILPKDRPEPPAAAIEKHVLCAAVAARDGWAEPGPDVASFARGPQTAAHSFLELRRVRGRHTAAWKWYEPAGLLIRASEPIVIGEEGKTFDRYIAWDRILLNESRGPGNWTVAVFIDGMLAASRSFEVR
ncbi:MAG: hypothetical protein PHI34_00305 [Acidobacteriota bacterium]|nr:hypothetical protein [Acidobacteriota bacterium]